MSVASVLIYDATGAGGSPVQWVLDAAWGGGGWLLGLTRQFDEVIAATSWSQVAARLDTLDLPVREVHFWGHGNPERVLVGADALTLGSVCDPGHPDYGALHRFATRHAGTLDLWWFRCCSTVEGPIGRTFAVGWSEVFRCRVAGHTEVIGVIQPGLHLWSPGLLSVRGPRTVGFWTQSLPATGW